MTFFGRGDAILRYPELIESYGHNTAAQEAIDRIDSFGPYVALHLTASEAKKIPPHPERLIEGLKEAGVAAVIVGEEGPDLPLNFRLHTDIVRNARKFIGTLSVFNVVAQIERVPSFVLVNRSIKEPTIYGLMQHNLALIEPWNVGRPIEEIYRDAIAWAQL